MSGFHQDQTKGHHMLPCLVLAAALLGCGDATEQTSPLTSHKADTLGQHPVLTCDVGGRPYYHQLWIDRVVVDDKARHVLSERRIVFDAYERRGPLLWGRSLALFDTCEVTLQDAAELTCTSESSEDLLRTELLADEQRWLVFLRLSSGADGTEEQTLVAPADTGCVLSDALRVDDAVMAELIR